jgi:hypothetical protein
MQAGSTLTSKAATTKQLDLRHVLLHEIAKARLPVTTEFAPLRMPQGKADAAEATPRTADAYYYCTQLGQTMRSTCRESAGGQRRTVLPGESNLL